MVGSMKLADEILANASVIPVECQEHILDVIKAMAFTRKVIEKNQTINVKKMKRCLRNGIMVGDVQVSKTVHPPQSFNTRILTVFVGIIIGIIVIVMIGSGS